MRPLSWLAVWLFGCTASPGEVEMPSSKMNVEKMTRTVAAGGVSVRDVKTSSGALQGNPMQWGRTDQPGRPWDLNALKPLLMLDAEQLRKLGNPHTLALALQTVILRADTGVYALRWVLEFGAGGGRTTFLIDAAGAQLLTVPADMLRVSLKTELLHEQDNVASYVAPSLPITASAFFAEGTTATNAPTYTQGFEVGAASTIVMTVPVGATAWKLCGEEPAVATSPFVATTTISMRTMPGSATLDQFLGDALIPFRDTEIPLPGMSGIVVIQNAAAGAVRGFIEWEIDL